MSIGERFAISRSYCVAEIERRIAALVGGKTCNPNSEAYDPAPDGVGVLELGSCSVETGQDELFFGAGLQRLISGETWTEGSRGYPLLWKLQQRHVIFAGIGSSLS